VKELRDCGFTAFISYAHADDAAWFDWVTQFRNELQRGLAALLRGVQLPHLHLSGENGPVAGVLSDELQERVAQSFAMIIVVHDNYAQSSWCLQELAYFKTLFGDDGFRHRLYIVALSESAMLGVAGGSAWQRLMPTADQVWIPFFEPTNRSRPLDVYLAPGLVSPAFREPFERLRSDLVAKLKASVATPLSAPSAAQVPAQAPAAAAAAASAAAPAKAPAATPAATPPTAGPSAVLGFVPPASAAALQTAAAALVQGGLQVTTLSPDAMFSDFAPLADAPHLVLAFDDQPAVGHLQMQREAWQQKGRNANALHFLDLRATPSHAAPPQGAAAFVAGLGVATHSVASLLAALVPPNAAPASTAPAAAARIYIESNRNERTLWEPLGEQILLKWRAVCEQLAPGRTPQLNLRTRGLPVDQIDSFPTLDDADGVVLLWGRKTQDALVAQINKVENKMSAGRDAPPGIVAYLMPPQPASDPMPAWGWQVLRFDAADENQVAVLAEENDQLTRFLRKVYQRSQQRDPVPGTAVNLMLSATQASANERPGA
jgi:TIR domain